MAFPHSSTTVPQTGESPELEQRDWYSLIVRVAERLNALISSSTRERAPAFLLEDASLPYNVRFTWRPGDSSMLCEATGNSNLAVEHRLGAEQQEWMCNMGWHPPGLGDAAHSRNFARVFYALSSCSVAASLAVSALRTTYKAKPRRLRWRSC